ncbi:hypothetical protein AB0H28_05635 [Micromonospora sp. NPDC050980]|uniref:hypothetical protein n=1 Tax=Micromonospora sp. NPDC050980 TaxID=3155161 RepID=UPI0034106F00
MSNVSRGRRAAGWAVLALTGLLSVGAVAAWSVATPPFTATGLYSLVDLLDGIVYGAVAWLLLTRQRTGSRLPGAIACAAAVGSALSAFAAQWQLAVGGPPVLSALHGSAWIPGLYALVVVMPWLLPDRPLGRLDRLAAATGAGYVTVTFAAAVTGPPPLGVLPLAPELREVRAALLRPLAPVLPYPLVGLGLLACAGLAWRWRRGPAAQRHGLGWATAGSTLLTLAFLTTLLPPVVPAAAPALLMLSPRRSFPPRWRWWCCASNCGGCGWPCAAPSSGI